MVAFASPRLSAAPPESAHDRRVRASIRVMIVDDHTLLRETLRLMLEARGEATVVGEAADGREAIDLAETLRPDVILMDTNMPGLNGIEATSVIRKRLPRTRILMLSGYGYEDRIAAALRAGAVGYVLKTSTAADLLAAIVATHRGERVLPPGVLAGHRAAPARAAAADCPLSAREREVLQLVSEGYTNVGIAQRLFISVKTVEAHKEHIVQKLGIRGTAELIRYAIRKGIIVIEPEVALAVEPTG